MSAEIVYSEYSSLILVLLTKVQTSLRMGTGWSALKFLIFDFNIVESRNTSSNQPEHLHNLTKALEV